MNTVPPLKQQVLTKDKDKEPQGDLRSVNLKRSVTVSVNSHKEEPARKKTKHDETTKEKFIPLNKIEWCSDTKTSHRKKDREENNIARTNNGKACKTTSLIFDHGTEMRNSQPQTDRKCLPKGDLRFKLLRKQ